MKLNKVKGSRVPVENEHKVEFVRNSPQRRISPLSNIQNSLRNRKLKGGSFKGKTTSSVNKFLNTQKFGVKGKMLFANRASTPKAEAPKENLNMKPSHSSRLPRKKELRAAVSSVVRPEVPGSLYTQHLFSTFQAMQLVKGLRQPHPSELEPKVLFLSKRAGYERKKTVIFDLDETLVHCMDEPSQGQMAITISFPSGETLRAGVNFRPFLRELLVSANRHFEVIVFTASHKCYADEVLDLIDPSGRLIHHRLYRENCVVVDGVHIKDLRVFGDRELQDLIIVDNAAYSFAYHVTNGIPIISWYDDAEDRELFKLIDYLATLRKLKDPRELNRRTFRLETFYEDYLCELMQNNKENS